MGVVVLLVPCPAGGWAPFAPWAARPSPLPAWSWFRSGMGASPPKRSAVPKEVLIENQLSPNPNQPKPPGGEKNQQPSSQPPAIVSRSEFNHIKTPPETHILNAQQPTSRGSLEFTRTTCLHIRGQGAAGLLLRRTHRIPDPRSHSPHPKRRLLCQ